jgi:hypothetical protein
LGKTEPTEQNLFGEKKLEKQNADVRRQGQNRRPITGSIRRHAAAYPPFYGAPGEFDALADDRLERAVVERFNALGLMPDAGSDRRH